MAHEERIMTGAMPNISSAEKARQWGGVVFEQPEALPAGSYQTVTVRYVAGSMGVDELGGIRISFRDICDFGKFQFTDPKKDNYVSVQSRKDIRLECEYSVKGNIRPYKKALTIHVKDGSLNEGDEIKVVFGDTTGGSRGWRLQTYVEAGHHMIVEADPINAHDYVVLPSRPAFDIVPAPAHVWQVNLPTLVHAGQEIVLRVKAEDVWGNPLRKLDLRPAVTLAPEGGKGEAVTVKPSHETGVLSYTLPAPKTPGVYYAAVSGERLKPGASNPMVVLPAGQAVKNQLHWCDFHGQTGETIGTGSVEEYFWFGRHFGFLDGSCHQGNDFQIDQAIWKRIVDAGNAANKSGEFVTFNGIEWSGNTPMGGDHNVLFNEDDPPLYRSSGWLASDGTKQEEVAPLGKLYATLKKHKAMTIPHIGGRPAALTETDPQVERLVELHSAWGTFEWVYKRAFASGFQVGFVANSDGHKCRPGASYPGASTFGVIGGLTCVLAPEKTRDAFWQAMQERRCYATSGQRIYVDTRADGQVIGSDLTVKGDFAVEGTVVGTAPLLGIDLLREDQVLETWTPPEMAQADGTWVLMRLGGCRVYGRERYVNWHGKLSLEGNRLEEAYMQGLYNPEHGIKSQDATNVQFHVISTGNSINLAMRLAEPGKGRIRFESEPCSFEVDVAELTPQAKHIFNAPIDQFLEIGTAPIGKLPMSHSFTFTAPAPHRKAMPYFIRVRQLDESKAWTSPWYVSKA